ncbi:hypothetical protein DXG01_006265, partial [Tephrocybe rancida]
PSCLPPPSNINNSSSSVASRAKWPCEGKKPNPFIDLKVEEDLRDNADIFDEAGADDEFDDFIDDGELTSDKKLPPNNPPIIDEAEEGPQRDSEVAGEEDEGDLDDNKEQYPDEEQYSNNDYPLTAAAISHKVLASHDDMEQWQSLLAHAHKQGRDYKSLYESFNDGLKPLPPPLLYRVRVKDGHKETAVMILANKLLMAGTHFEPSVKSIIGRVSCPGWVFIESNGVDASNLCANISDVYP